MAPLIIITNDDGIQSPGLRAVVRAVMYLGDILVVAPREQQTSMGRAFYGKGNARPVVYTVNHRRIRAYAVPTSPAVTVRHAIMLIAERPPDLLISGINYGENIGSGITISGTVGAALEAAALGYPAIAASISTPLELHRTHSRAVNFAVAAHFVREWAKHVLERGMPRGVDVLNINIPRGATESTPWRWTRVSRSNYFFDKVKVTSRGKRFEGYELVADRSSVEPDSDIRAILDEQIVSVSPLTIDLTAPVLPEELAEWAK